jgi:carboxyl-terminal processing protease
MTLSQSQRSEMFAKIVGLVQSKFYDPNFNGKKWPEIVDLHRQNVLAGETPESFESAVTRMFKDLDSSGLGILGPQSTITPRNAINASLTSIVTPNDGRRWVFQDVLPGGVADRAGLTPGDALISIDNNDVAPPEKPSFVMGREIPIVYVHGKQKTQTMLATALPKYRDNPYTEPQSIRATLSSDRLARLKISLFPGQIGIDFSNKLTETFSGTLADATRLLIDLRGNPGGGVGALRLMSHLTPDVRPVGYSLDRPTAEGGVARESLPRFNRIPKLKIGIAVLAVKFGTKKSVVLETEGLGQKPFHGKVVLLVNEHSTGAAEMVTQFAKENALATIIGSKTPGHLVSRSAFKIGNGYRITIPIGAYVSWQGTRIEGKGIEPDISVPWSYEDALNGVDNQLNAAVEVANGF